MTDISLIALCVLVAVGVVSGEIRKVGDKLELTPGLSSVNDNIRIILWKHGKNKLAEWDSDYKTLDYYGEFIGRTTLDNVTGALVINNLTKADSGELSLEVNSNSLQKTYSLSVINAVPKPTIRHSCKSDKTSCNLTCEGNSMDAGNVAYSWKRGQVETQGPRLTVDATDDLSVEITCGLKNAVSEETSGPFDKNLLINYMKDEPKTKIGIIVFVLLFAGLILFILVHKFMTGVWFFDAGAMPWEGDFWKKKTGVHARANGTNSPREDSVPEEEVMMPNKDRHDSGAE